MITRVVRRSSHVKGCLCVRCRHAQHRSRQDRVLEIMDESVSLMRRMVEQSDVSASTNSRVGVDAEFVTPVTEVDRLNRELSNWREEAHQAHQNARLYKGIVENIGRKLGSKAYTCDDGSESSYVLVLKVPEIIDELLAFKRRHSGAKETE